MKTLFALFALIALLAWPPGAHANGGSDEMSTETMGTQTVALDKCVGPQDLLDSFHAPPNFLASAVIWRMLEGDAARTFLIQTGGAGIANVDVIYLIHVPVKHPTVIMSVLADEEGCLIDIYGERAAIPRNGAKRVIDLERVKRLLDPPSGI